MRERPFMSFVMEPVESAAFGADDLEALSDRAEDAARMLRLLGNTHRLMILCCLIGADELPVGALVDRLGISQSALSQHLAKLREDGLVTFRRDGQTLHYRVVDPRAARLLMTLKNLYCPD